jgi:hypothetical protein
VITHGIYHYQFNKTDYDTYECCYLQKPEYTEAAAAFAPGGAGTFKDQTNLFHPDVVAYYTASPSQTAMTNFKKFRVYNWWTIKNDTKYRLYCWYSDATI